MNRPLRIGTRGSPLALAQARMAADALRAAHGWAEEAIEIDPANLDAYDTGIIEEGVLETLPSAPQNVENAIVFNTQWWADNMDEVTKRFDLFIQE